MSMNLFGSGFYPEFFLVSGIIWLAYIGIISLLYALRNRMDFSTSMVMLHVGIAAICSISELAQAVVALAVFPLLALFTSGGRGYNNYGDTYTPLLLPLIPLFIGIFIGYLIGSKRSKPS